MKQRRPDDPRARSHRFGCLVVLAIVMGGSHAAHAQDTDACINASEKALALGKAEKLIGERASLSTCAAWSCPDAVRSSCQQRLAEVNRSIPSIVFFAKDEGGRDLASVKLAIDGTPYRDHLDGSAIVLDPGEHVFRFETAGQPAVVKRFVMHQGEQNRRENIVLGPGAIASTGETPGSTAPGTQSASSSPAGTAADTDAAGPRSKQRTIGLVVLGVGGASLAAGAIVGGLSMAAHSSYEKNCGSNIGAPAGRCNQLGVEGEHDAATKGTISTILFVAGGVAAIGGGALFFTAPKGGASTEVGVGPGNVVVRGQF